jgi:hypothetical protein
VKRMASIAAQFLEEEKPDRAAAVESNCAAA